MRIAFLFALFVAVCAAAPARADFEHFVLIAFAHGPGPDDDDTKGVQRKPNYLRVNTDLTMTTGKPGFYEVQTKKDCTAVVREVATIDGAPKLQREYSIDVRRAVALVDRDGDTLIWKGGSYGSAKVLDNGLYRDIELRTPAGAAGSAPRKLNAGDIGFLQAVYAHRIKQTYCR